MKYFAIVFLYEDGKYSATRNLVGVHYIKAESKAVAEAAYGYGGILYVREVTLDEIALSGVRR